MRIAEIIGSVTLSKWHPALQGARWLVGVPFSLEALQQGQRGDGEDIVMYDDLGAGDGSQVGVSEGAEAAAPFLPKKVPVDAFCASILDHVSVG